MTKNVPQRQAGFLIAQIHLLSGRILSKKLKKYNLSEITPAQGRILFTLWQNDEISIQELAQKTSLGKSTLTSMLDKLETKNYITRVFSKEDRRKTYIKLTRKDKKLKNTYDEVSREMSELFYEGFSEIDKDQFEDYLKRIYNNLVVGGDI